MTAHVAERGEGRGRVVLRLTGTQAANEQAIRAAIHVAQAFHSEIESLFVYDRQIADAAGYGFVREIAAPAIVRFSSAAVAREASEGRGIDVAGIQRQLELIGRHVQRRVGELAALADVPVHMRFVSDTPLRALSEACQVAGPWNVVALAEPFTAESLSRLETLFERVTGMTGVVLVGPRAAAPDRGSAVVAVIEDPERVTGMLRTAERLAGASRSDVVLAVAAASRAAQSWLRTEVAHAMEDRPAVPIVELGRAGGGAGVIAEALRQLRPGFVIAEHGGLVVPREGDFRPLGVALGCPLLVVR
ncbi:MAG: hypothetical protein KDJ18_01730 [Hyphomicrobiaceae bacterium]|nr:hypothetical protein [Hyphomicrobiaceae bacterium]